MSEKSLALSILEETKQEFILACQEAGQLQLVNNFGAAFTAVAVVSKLRELLTDEIMTKVFMPLANTRIGFMTDKRPTRKDPHPEPYSIAIVRDAIIEAVSCGLQPTGNQFNIIAERMYPTKEGYTALLQKLGVKYITNIGADTNRLEGYAEIPYKVDYAYNGEKHSIGGTATVKKDQYSSPDQLRGKAERRAKKSLYEYITGCDLGDADETSSAPEDGGEAQVIETKVPQNANTQHMPSEPANKEPQPQAPVNQPSNPAPKPQTQAAGSRDVPPLFQGKE